VSTLQLPVRPTARVVLLDDRDRVLLMKGRLPSRPDGEGAWFTIGGGVEPGETMAQAAAREITEETGWLEFELGPVLWRREGVMRLSQPTLLREEYVLARCQGGDPDRSGWHPHEHDLIDDIRWWDRLELLATTDRVFPPGLAALLEDVIAGCLPAEPPTLPWT
jgi:8-oxo-dGTP pyrophosphatase MutT (NUDIX family)